jgi:hypothetical protein
LKGAGFETASYLGLLNQLNGLAPQPAERGRASDSHRAKAARSEV